MGKVKFQFISKPSFLRITTAQSGNHETVVAALGCFCGKSLEGGTLDIANVETADIVFTAVDSRNFPGTDTDEALTLIPYARLTNKANCKRLDPTSGKAVCWGVLSEVTRSGTSAFGPKEAVKKLQQSLNDTQKANLVVDGIYREKTRDAVKAYQTAK